MTTLILACLPTKTTLNKLLTRCTTAVAATAVLIGKKSAKAGISRVPSPNPEKRVRADTTIATVQMTAYSIMTLQCPFQFGFSQARKGLAEKTIPQKVLEPFPSPHPTFPFPTRLCCTVGESSLLRVLSPISKAPSPPCGEGEGRVCQGSARIHACAVLLEFLDRR